MENDYFDEEFGDEEEDSEPMILAIKDGEATIKKPFDYVELEKKDMELIKGFIKENQKLFNEYIKKHDILSENQENHSQQPLKTNSNVGSKSYEVEKNELGSMETGAITSSGVEDHLPKSNFSSADIKFVNQKDNEVEE